MNLTKIIETEPEYEVALERVDELLDAAPDTDSAEGRELQLLLVLIEKYEDEHHLIDLPDPIQAIKVRMDDLAVHTHSGLILTSQALAPLERAKGKQGIYFCQ